MAAFEESACPLVTRLVAMSASPISATSTLSGFPRGMYFVGLKYLFRTIENPRLGSYPEMRYGPVAGIVPFRIAVEVLAGTGAAKMSARIVRKSPRGFASLIVIVRFLLLVTIPEMFPPLVGCLEYASAPAMSV